MLPAMAMRVHSQLQSEGRRGDALAAAVERILTSTTESVPKALEEALGAYRS